MEMEEHTQSLEFCRRSLSYARRLGDLSLEANCLCNLGNDWVRLGRYPEALEAGCLAAELGEKLGDGATVSRALANAAQAYAGTGRYAEASGYFARALNLARSLQDTENVCGSPVLHGSVTGETRGT